jgi:tetratricopeptide (TPR) repeat protein
LLGRVRTLVRSAREGLNNAIADFIEDLPDMADEYARSYGARRLKTPEAKYERWLKQNIRRDRIMFGRDNIYGTITMMSLANFYRSQRRFGEAEAWYLKAVSILEHQLKLGEQRLSEAYSHLGEFYLEYMHNERAEQAYERAVASKSVQHGAQSPELVRDLQMLSEVRLKLEKFALARESLLKLLAIQEDTLGPTHPELGATISQLELVERKLGNAAQAATWQAHARIIDSLSVLEPALGAEHIGLIPDLELLASLYHKQGKHELAARVSLQVRLNLLAWKVRGPEYPGIMRDLRELARLYEQRNEPGDATMAFRLRARADHIVASRRERGKNADI